jgi:hypothetical protein
MRTNLKVILAATAIATLASPVMAQSESHRYAAATSVSADHGAAARARTPRVAPAIEGNPFHIDDAVHVPFPQDGRGL